MTKSLCSNCRNQMTGFDGGFFGLPFTCECRIYGETQGRKNCSDFEKKITRSYLLDKIKELEKENEQLRQSVEYWQKKYEEGTETFQISGNDTTFQFNSNQAQLYTIKSVSPNGVVRLGNGHKAKWRMKDVREISAELPSFEDFNRETFMQMRNKFHKFDKDVFGRIIYNIYFGTFEGYI